MIIFKDVVKNYILGDEEIHALDHVDFHIKENEFVGIIGPSGSGKSTLMNIMGCLDVVSSGEYFLDGLAIEQYGQNELAAIRNEKIGFVFQSFNLLNRMTIEENIELPLIYQGVSQGERKERVRDALEKVELWDRRSHTPNKISGGQQQRTAIARAIVTEPSLILADEPTGNLDTKTGRKILDIFNGLYEEGKTIVLITHDKDTAATTKRQMSIIDGKMTEGMIW
jgi:putative ABC transport system ATP-binding protein